MAAVETRRGVPIGMTADEMLAEARRRTGIDIVDEEVREPLAVLLRSYDEESLLHAEGAREMRERTLRMLANRLRMQRDFAAHPEIAEQEVLAPLIVGGLARTGSTLTQKLLAATGQFNWLNYWHTFNPSLITGDPAESPQPRIDEAAAYLDYFDRMSPDTKYAHYFEMEAPEEESLILEHSFRSPVGLGWSPIYAYLEWLMGQDWRLQFLHLRDTLKYLQWQGIGRPGRRWVLKSPLYAGLEPFLFEVFPDATIVMTHRPPEDCIASGLRLLELFYMPFTQATSAIDVEGYVAGQQGAIAGHLANRRAMPDARIVDVTFAALMADPVGTVERICTAAGAPFGQEARAGIAGWTDDNPQHKHGAYRYSLADYGLTREGLRARFADYEAFIRDLAARA